MIVLFEGPDCAGKSTMIQAVAAEHVAAGRAPESVAVWHAGPFPDGGDPYVEYVAPLASLTPSRDWLVLIDRWHVGELVYGPIFRGGSRLSEPQRDWIDAYLRELGCVLVHLTATTMELTRRLAERGDDMVGPEHVEVIRSAFVAAIQPQQGYKIHVMAFDTTRQRVEPTAGAIYQAARTEVAIAESVDRHPSRDHRPYEERFPWPT